MKRMNAQSLVIEVVAVTRVEIVVRTAAVEKGTGTGIGVTKYPGFANYAW